MDTDFKQLCIGWTLAFVLVVGSILILGQFGPCGPDSLRPFEAAHEAPLPFREPGAVELHEEVE